MSRSAHIDTFAHDRLPPPDQRPRFIFELPELQFNEQLNCAAELLDRHVEAGRGDRICVRAPGGPDWTYAELQQQANRIAGVLVHRMGLVPGNRVLLRAPNKPLLVACWFAVVKAGAIAVGTASKRSDSAAMAACKASKSSQRNGVRATRAAASSSSVSATSHRAMPICALFISSSVRPVP